jgi:TrmH family RNA methyltransferase
MSRVVFVLVRPARAANVGAACRALKNMGFSSLRLVEAAVDASEPAVRAPAYGAWDVLDAATRHDRLIDAVADATVVVGASGREGPESRPPRALAAELSGLTAGETVAFVFGPEASGLTNEELALCHRRVRIPSDPAQPSLNLAQAVLVVAYEMSLARASHPAPEDAEPPATAGELEGALADLRDGLLGIGYLNPANPDGILAELRALLVRARPRPREVVLLRGLARQVRWAAGHIARSRRGDDNPPPGGNQR